MRHPVVPIFEPLVGGLWWIVGAIALDAGTGTVVLAAGLAVIVGLVVTVRRRFGAGAELPHGGRRRLARTVVVAVAATIGVAVGLGALGLGEVTVPVVAAVSGLALFAVSSQLGERVLLAAGAAMMVLGATGALVALQSVDNVFSQGVVGLVSGALVWLAGAHRSGLLAEARGRVQR